MPLPIAPRTNPFPWDIFDPSVYQNFKDISKYANIPLDFLGTQAIYSIAALSGNMYMLDMNGGVKPTVFIAKIGPSGIGKSPAFNKLLGDVVRPLRIKHRDDYEVQLKQWRQRERDARNEKPKQDFDEDPPTERIRIIEGGTVEALAKHSITSPAGFGVIYDEGERFFDEINRYSGGGSSNAFWNQTFDGKTSHLLRVDSDRERFVRDPAICVDIGLQTNRLPKYFTEDAIDSGILNRFLVVESDYVLLNEEVDMFTSKARICDEWSNLIKFLFTKGLTFNYDQRIIVQADPGGRQIGNHGASSMIRKSNAFIQNKKGGDHSSLIINYRSKSFNYFSRLALILAIMRNPREPVVTQNEFFGAQALCEYFEANTIKILRRLHDAGQTGLTENEQRLLDTLPESFTGDQAAAICKALGISDSFFYNSFRRKYCKGFIYKKEKNIYEKN